MRLAALSVDLDEIPCYAAIHGLTPQGNSAHAIYDRALPRLATLFREENVPCTFFVIGRDAHREQNANALRRLAQAGHELGCHTENHPYDLTRLSDGAQRSELRNGIASIQLAAGVTPTGFRAPGYTVDERLLHHVRDAGFAYDSSVFPCPPYYGAKATAMGLIRARGRRSQSVLDHPRVLRAPADPYRIGTDFTRRGDGLAELPIGVTRGMTGRLPFIGTSVLGFGDTAAKALTRAIIGRPLVNLELHGIDLADAREDGLDWLAPHQPDLRRPGADKAATLRKVIGWLREAGYRFVRLDEVSC